MLIRNVVLRFGVNQQRGHDKGLVQLGLQVDVVVACREGARPRKSRGTFDHCGATELQADVDQCHAQKLRSRISH